MQTPEEFASDYLRANSFYTQEYSYQVLRDDDGYELSLLIAARDAEIRQDAFEAGYAQGHNDTVEGCVRDMHDAANDYIAAIIGEEE